MIGLLAETLGIFVPSVESLERHLAVKNEEDREKLISLYKEKNPELEYSVIEQLMEVNGEGGGREEAEIARAEETGEDLLDRATTRLEQMKINSLEIIISFY